MFKSLNIEQLQAEFFVKLIEIYWNEIISEQPLMEEIIQSYYKQVFVQLPYPVNKILCENITSLKLDSLEDIVAYIIHGKIHEVTLKERELASIEILKTFNITPGL